MLTFKKFLAPVVFWQIYLSNCEMIILLTDTLESHRLSIRVESDCACAKHACFQT